MSGWLRNPTCAMTSKVAVPAGMLDEIRVLPVAPVGRGANHQHGIDTHVDDAAVLGEAALRHEALHQAGGVFDREIAPRGAGKRFQASGKGANIHGGSGSHREKSQILSMSVAHGLGVMRAEKGERHVWQIIQRSITR